VAGDGGHFFLEIFFVAFRSCCGCDDSFQVPEESQGRDRQKSTYYSDETQTNGGGSYTLWPRARIAVVGSSHVSNVWALQEELDLLGPGLPCTAASWKLWLGSLPVVRRPHLADSPAYLPHPSHLC
jgi:hypothetical protein